jgi:hypothetical protein
MIPLNACNAASSMRARMRATMRRSNS